MYVVIYIAVIVIIAIREKDKKTISKRKRLSQCIFLTSASFNTEVTEELKQTMSSIAQDKVHGIEGLKQLLDHCADPNIPDIPDKWGKTALMWAIMVNNIDVVRLLLDNIYLLNKKDFHAFNRETNRIFLNYCF